MKKLEFRTLRAEEIECRVGTTKKDSSGKVSGFSLLLYKDARVDQRLLDEVVGAFNWQRKHTRDNANCIVSIYDDEKQMWVEKEDVGTESNTEKEKGLASDSFKRACFNWGIGRELYDSPFIWVDAKSNSPYDKYEVKEIVFDDNRKVKKLIIMSSRTKSVVYTYGSTMPKVAEPKTTAHKEETPETEMTITNTQMAADIMSAKNRADFEKMMRKYEKHLGVPEVTEACRKMAVKFPKPKKQ